MFSMKSKLRLIGAFAALATLALAISCRGFFVNPTLTSLAIGPANLTLTPSTPGCSGCTYQMVATATYSDGSTSNVTGHALWTSSNTSVANFTSPGFLTAGTLQALGDTLPGTTSVSASDGTVSSSAETVNVCPTVESMTLTVSASSSGTGGNSVSVTGGSPVYFVMMATFNGVTGSQDVTDNVTWTIGNTAALPSISDGTGDTVSDQTGTFTVFGTLCGATSNTVSVTTTS